MSRHLKIFSTAAFLFCFTTLLRAEPPFGYQSNETDVAQLRKLFIEAVGQDFEIVKDILNKRPDQRGGETYWLVHVKPKRAGHYALKYTYRYTHKYTHPEEGENELFIRVGGKKCHRYNNNNLGLGNVCLGDTVIVPIRTDNLTGHQFSLKSTYQDAETIGQIRPDQPLPVNLSDAEQIINPLETNLKYLGTQRRVSPHRNYGAETITYTAFFEAKSAGRFNLGLSSIFGNEAAAETTKSSSPLNGLPIIIIDPGTPVTALVYAENTINYSDNKRFSGHAGHNFLTKLLILQPGDVFAVEYAGRTERWGFGDEKTQEKRDKIEAPKVVIHKSPFILDKDWSYNEWLIDYLPVENK